MFSPLSGPFGPTLGAANTAGGGTAPTITSPSFLVDGTVNTVYPTTTFTATGTAPITWSLTPGSTLPAGMTFVGGVLAGTPTATSSGSITFRATNAFGFADRPLTLTVNAAGTSTVSDPVTYAVTATGTGTTYNVYNDTDMDNVPWGALGAGDAVNIYWKSTPYTRKWGMGRNLDRLGTQTNPIVINGVTDASGNRPRLNWNGGRTATGSNPSLLPAWVAENPSVTPSTKYDAFNQSGYNIEAFAGISVWGGFGSKPSFFQIKNLEMYGARGSFTNLSGNTQQYVGNGKETSGVRFQTGRDCLIENCVIKDCGWGVFTQIDSQAQNGTFERLTLRCNRIDQCGWSGSNTEHNAYVQCVNPVIEGNYFGKLTSGAAGSSYKSRSSGEIFRYNWVESNSRSIDLVEPEEQGNFDGSTPGFVGSSFIIGQTDYGVDHVYGNVIVIDDVLSGSTETIQPLHFGGDKNGQQDLIPTFTPGPAALFQSPLIGGKKIYRQTLYFYNNTYICNTKYAIRAFDINESTASVEMWNNLFWGSSAGNTNYGAGLFYVNSRAGTIKYLASNVRYASPTPSPSASWQAIVPDGVWSGYTDPTKAFETTTQAAITANPSLTSISTYDYTPQVGGSAAGVGSTSFPSGLPSSFKNLPVQFQPVKRSNGMVARPSLTTVGALQIGI